MCLKNKMYSEYASRPRALLFTYCVLYLNKQDQNTLGNKEYQGIPRSTREYQEVPKKKLGLPENTKQYQVVPGNTKEYQHLLENT